MIEQITVNPINEALFSADFIKGFRCGAKRQFQADVEEIAKAKFDRPTGEWVWSDEDASWKCGRCDCVFDEIDWKPNYNFCPNCGADMRKPKLQYGDTDTLQGGLMSAT